ncbi:gamma-glutamyltransferase [Hydromonas duriensis]|nr:gamma-glutamyltransferase [Hydromonas duriensis]
MGVTTRYCDAKDLKSAAVAAPDAYGAIAAKEILRQGGNAVDASVATAFTLAVTKPDAGNLGGGGFMTIFLDGKPYFLDYREVAPQAATANMYLDDKGNVIENLSLIGNLAVAVPGTVKGMWAAHQRFGRLKWAQVLAPAIRYAQKGFTVSKYLNDTRNASLKDFSATNFAQYFKGMKTGQRFVQPELEQTLRRIAQNGAPEFYEGHTADLLVTQMSKNQKGIITKEDLKQYQAVWREPLQVEWNGFNVITAPPPSSGGIALLQLLKMKANLAPHFNQVPLNSPKYIHLVSEMEKRVFADRAKYLGDPAFVNVPVTRLLDDTYVEQRAAEVNPKTISPTPNIKAGLEKPQTTHFSIVDKWGNAVSNTYTLNGDYGSGVVVEGAGFLLNDEMDDFSSKPGAPNLFGVVGGDANAIAPHKRPLSSMSPTILTKKDTPVLVIGTPGGSRIFTSIFQTITNIYDYKMPLRGAVAAMRFHHQLLPKDTIFFEPYKPIRGYLAKALQDRGYKLENQGWTGDVQAILIRQDQPMPVSDPRGTGTSLIVPNK